MSPLLFLMSLSWDDDSYTNSAHLAPDVRSKRWDSYTNRMSPLLLSDGTEHWDDDSYTNRMSPLLLLCHWALRWWQLYQQNVSSLAPDDTEHWDDDSYTNRMSPLLLLMSGARDDDSYTNRMSPLLLLVVSTEMRQLYQQNVSSLAPDDTEHWDDDSYTNSCLLSCSWWHWALRWWQLYQQNVSSLAPDVTEQERMTFCWYRMSPLLLLMSSEHWDDDSYTNSCHHLLLLMALSTEMMTAIPTECLISCSWCHWARDDDSYTNRMSPLLLLMVSTEMRQLYQQNVSSLAPESLSTEMMTAIPTECLLSCSWCHWALRWWQLYQQNVSSLAPDDWALRWWQLLV